MSKLKKIYLDEAVGHICNTCKRPDARNPFFFLVGAGISYPPVPLARQIIQDCKQEAGPADEPDGLSSMDRYSWWMEKAFHSPDDRSRYFRRLIEGTFVSQANLRLAHLLYSKSISNIVATANFDDFISRSLTMFGARHIICDHPSTSSRIDPENSDLQILHVHGSYWFYDCRNLAGEIQSRAERSAATVGTMADCLDRLLSNRSPIVVGYSGWEKDVFMQAFRRRIASGLRYNVYWFCHRSADLETLPPEIKEHPNIYFVVPQPRREKDEGTVDGDTLDSGAQKFAANVPTEVGNATIPPEATLSATDVFERLANRLQLEDLPLAADPFRFYADQLRNSLPPQDSSGTNGVYSMSRVIRRLEVAAEKIDGIIGAAEERLEEVLAAVRTSQFGGAVEAAERVPLEDLDLEQLRRLIDQLLYAVEDLSEDEKKGELTCRGYGIVERAGRRLLADPSADRNDRATVARAAVAAIRALNTSGRLEEAVVACSEVVGRFGDEEDAALQEVVARALVNKGWLLGRLKRREEGIAAYGEVVERFGDAGDAALREAVAKALVNKGVDLGRRGGREEAVAAYQEVVERFGDAEEVGLREEAAKALVNKGFNLGRLERREEAVAAYDEVVERFGDAEEAVLRDGVAKALVNKGIELGRLERREEAVAAYDEVVERFGDAEEAELREHVAKANELRDELIEGRGTGG